MIPCSTPSSTTNGTGRLTSLLLGFLVLGLLCSSSSWNRSCCCCSSDEFTRVLWSCWFLCSSFFFSFHYCSMRVSASMSLTIWLRLFGLSEKNGFCSWIALTNLSFLAQRMQQARVQMHPDADGTHTAEEARHDSVLEERRRRPPRQWL